MSMSNDLHIVTYDDQKPVLDVLTGIPQPTPMSDCPGILAGLGWESVGEGTVTRCLGFPPTRQRPWGLPGQTWDLPAGGQVDLLQGMRGIVLYVSSANSSKVERDQIRRGELITW